MAYFYIGSLLATAGRSQEAIENLEKGMRLSPRDPLLFGFLSSIAWAHIAAERYEEAVEWGKRSLKHRSDWADGLGAVAVGCVHLERMDEARAAAAKMGQSIATVELLMAASPPELIARVTDALRKAGLEE